MCFLSDKAEYQLEALVQYAEMNIWSWTTGDIMICTVPGEVIIVMMLLLLMVVLAMVMLMLITMAIIILELVWSNYIDIHSFFRNVKLLQHFIDPYTGQTLPTSKTNICQKQFRLLDIEVERAKDHGLIEVDVPQIEYDYELYKKQGWGKHKWPNSSKLISF